MANVKSIKVFYTDIGLDLYGMFQDDDTGALLDDIDGNFRATPSSAYIHFTDCSSATPAIPGKYIINESRIDWGTRNVTGYIYNQLSSGVNNENTTTDDKVTMKLLTVENDVLIDNSKLALKTTVLTRASSATAQTILTETQSHPTLAEIEATTILAKEATLGNATYGLAATKAKVDAVQSYIDVAYLPTAGQELDKILEQLASIGYYDPPYLWDRIQDTQLNVQCIQKTALDIPVVTDSLADWLTNKDVNKTYNKATDSLEALSDKVALDSTVAKETTVLTRLSSASGNTIDNISSSASSILNQIEGDSYIDITTTPWEEIVKQKGTSIVLIRKKLYDKDSVAITAITQIIGKKMES